MCVSPPHPYDLSKPSLCEYKCFVYVYGCEGMSVCMPVIVFIVLCMKKNPRFKLTRKIQKTLSHSIFTNHPHLHKKQLQMKKKPKNKK